MAWLQRRYSKGDTIVEVMISATILIAVLGVAYATSNRSLQESTDSDARGQAVGYAQQQIEFIRNWVSQGRPASPNYHQAAAFCILPATGGTQAASSSTGLCEFPDPSPFGNFLVGDTYNNSSSTYTITVKWDSAHGNGQNQTVLYYRE